MTLQIVTFGNGEILKGVLDAVAMCLNPDTGTLYTPLVRMGMIFSVLWAALYSIWGDYVRAWGRSLIPFIVIPPLLFVPTSTVYIHDVISNYRDKVDNVPYGLAYLSSFISTIGYEITRQVERVFAGVEDLKYHKSGFLMASNLIQQAKTFRIVHEDTAENMRHFIIQCVAYEAMLGRKYTVEDIRHSPDLWSLVSNQASPIRSFLWKNLQAEGISGHPAEVISCREGVKRFNALWKGELDRVSTLFGTKLFSFSHPQTAKQEFLKYLPLSYGFLSGLSKSAEEILKQQMMIYAVVDGIEQKSVALGNSPNFATRRAYLQQRTTYETLGTMASETLITMKAVLEAIVYAAFLFVVPLSVLPFGVRILLSWVQVLLWLQMWAPLYAVLNFIMATTARYKSIAMLSISSPEGITMASSVGLMNLNADMAAMAGYLAISIPFLAIALVKGVGSFVHLASHLGNVAQGVAGQAAGEAVTGNYSFGNWSQGNVQIDNSHQLTQSHAASYRNNSYQLLDGRTEISTLSDGSQIVQIGTPNLPLSLNIAETQSAQLSEMATQSSQKALQLTESASQNLASSYRDMVDLSRSLGRLETLNDASQQNITVEQTHAIHKTAQMLEDFAHQQGISTQKSAELFAEVSLGGGLLIKAGAGGKTATHSTDQVFLQKALKYAEDHNFQQAAREAAQASNSLTHSLSDESSQRLSKNLSETYEVGLQQRTEASKNWSDSQSYAQQAMDTLAHSASLNANYNQQFLDWLATQPADHTHGHIGQQGAAHILANSPQEARAYAHKFMAQHSLMPRTFSKADREDLLVAYQAENLHPSFQPTKRSLRHLEQEGMSLFTQESTNRGKVLREDVTTALHQQKQTINQAAFRLKQQGENIQEKVDVKEGKSVVLETLHNVDLEIYQTLHGKPPTK